MHSLDYSVLRLVPNARRQEIINIGLVVFFDDGFKIKLLKNYSKIRAICPAYQLDLFPTLEDDIKFVVGESANYDEVSKAFRSIGGFILGNKTTLHVESSSDISDKLEGLMKTFVYPETNLPDHQSPTLYQELRRQLLKIADVSNNKSDLNGFQIVEWYAVDEQGWLKSEFAFKTDNRIVFIQTVDLRVSDRRELFRTISSHRMVGEAIREIFNDRAEIIVTYRISAGARSVGGEHLLSLIDRYADEVCDFEDSLHLQKLTDKIAWNHGPNRSLPLYH